HVSGPDNRAVGTRNGFVILQPDPILWLNLIPMIVEMADRNELRERFKAAFMVRMPVADDHLVDALQSGALCGGEYALRVAIPVPGIAGVEEQRFTGGRDEQRRSAAFDVNPVDFQIAALLRRG